MMHFPVMERFYSIQGEGKHSGTASYFIRLGGCDVGCVWCDVKDSWESAAHPIMSVEEIVEDISAEKCQAVIITGGEPAMYDLSKLCEAIRKKGVAVHIETSGVYELKGEFDWICCSPKKFKEALPEVLAVADELKVIVFHPSDLEWGRSYEGVVQEGCELYMQPEWSKRDKMHPLIMDFLQEYPHWKISIQIHKYMGVD